MLGIEDHGIMTFMIHISFGGTGQGFGGFALDRPPIKQGYTSPRLPTAYGMGVVMHLLRVFDVDRWEKVQGLYCRVRRKDGSWNSTLQAIGHIVQDRWFDPEKYYTEGDWKLSEAVETRS